MHVIFCRHRVVAMVKNSPNGVSVHVGAHVLRTTSAISGSFLCILGSFLNGDGNPDDCYVLYESF